MMVGSTLNANDAPAFAISATVSSGEVSTGVPVGVPMGMLS